jgi:hypothetical protein
MTAAISYWKQREAENGAPKIEIMADAMFTPEVH